LSLWFPPSGSLSLRERVRVRVIPESQRLGPLDHPHPDPLPGGEGAELRGS
jgi:hypothetical protein